MKSWGITDKGICRTNNQDSFVIVSDDKGYLGVVCDGIGGNNAGDVASRLACESMRCSFIERNDVTEYQKWLKACVEKANDSVLSVAKTNKEFDGMGTTLVGYYHDDENDIVINVGDSRCYILTNDNRLVQISEDHTLVNELVKNTGIDFQTACQIVGKNVISKACGVYQDTEADVFVINQDYKYLLLCSDGLHGYVDEKVITQVLISDNTLQQKCEALVSKANEAGGWDNITAIICNK